MHPRIEKGKDIKTIGLPIIRISKDGKIIIGDKFKINNGLRSNLIGRNQRCIFYVSGNGILIIGNNVGMSSTAIVSQNRIVIGNNVRIGGNVVIYDTDFHSLIPSERLSEKDPDIKTSPVKICDNVFIGAHSTILKGVTIGDNAVIGAGSVVAKDVPANQIWAGNPARFIRALD